MEPSTSGALEVRGLRLEAKKQHRAESIGGRERTGRGGDAVNPACANRRRQRLGRSGDYGAVNPGVAPRGRGMAGGVRVFQPRAFSSISFAASELELRSLT